jgi:hypothetical protein
MTHLPHPSCARGIQSSKIAFLYLNPKQHPATNGVHLTLYIFFDPPKPQSGRNRIAQGKRHEVSAALGTTPKKFLLPSDGRRCPREADVRRRMMVWGLLQAGFPQRFRSRRSYGERPKTLEYRKALWSAPAKRQRRRRFRADEDEQTINARGACKR